MKFDFVMLLPLAAIALAVSFPLSYKKSHFPDPFASGRYRRMLLRRLAVVVVPLASLIAVFIPFQGLNNISKALILCAMILAPAIGFHHYLNISYRNKRIAHINANSNSHYDVPSRIQRKIARSTKGTPSELRLISYEKTMRNIQLVEQLKDQG